MKVIVFNGSPRKKDSYRIVKLIQQKMNKKGNVNFEYINLKELEINECIGCMQCFQKGEEYCPLKDDVIRIKEKLIEADGIIFVSPVYALNITGMMKRVVDRMSYMFHRSELVAKPAITVVTTGGGGQKNTQEYLKLIACGWGCHLVDRLSVISPLYFREGSFFNSKYNNKINKKIEKITEKFYESIISDKKPIPTFYDLYMFHGLKSKTYISEADCNYWHENGWLGSNYYYKTQLNPLKWIFGKILNFIIDIMAKKAFCKKNSV